MPRELRAVKAEGYCMERRRSGEHLRVALPQGVELYGTAGEELHIGDLVRFDDEGKVRRVLEPNPPTLDEMIEEAVTRATRGA